MKKVSFFIFLFLIFTSYVSAQGIPPTCGNYCTTDASCGSPLLACVSGHCSLPNLIQQCIANPTYNGCCIVTTPTPTNAPTQIPTPTPTKILTHIDGFEIGESRTNIVQKSVPYISELRPNFIRIHLHWTDMVDAYGNPNWNSSEWTTLVSSLQTVRSAYPNTKIILTIKGTPMVWRDHDWNPNWSTQECTRPTATFGLNALRTLGKVLAGRLSTSVDYFELWNEPDVDIAYAEYSHYFGCWIKNGDYYEGGQFYATALRLFHEGILLSGKNVPLIAGAMTCGNNINCSEFIRGMKNGNLLSNSSLISFHNYQGYWNQITDDPTVRTWRVDDPNYQWDIDDYYHLIINSLGMGNYSLIADEIGFMCGSNTCKVSGSSFRQNFLFQQGDWWVETHNWAVNHNRLIGIIDYTLNPTDWMDTNLLNKDWSKKCIYNKFLETNLGNPPARCISKDNGL